MDNCTCTRKDPFGQSFNMNEKTAYDKGYRCTAGKVVSPSGRILKLSLTTTGYQKFSIKVKYKRISRKQTVLVHRLVAYQKYGDRLYTKCVVRHLDGNKLNNRFENILLGSQLQNIMDIPKQTRRTRAITAATANRKFTDAQIQEIRDNHTSYQETMEQWGIRSKGSLHHILNHEYVTQRAV